MRTKLLLLVLIVAWVAFSSSAIAQNWTYKYDSDNYANLEGWVMITGFTTDMAVVTDPDDPTNNLLHITSADGGDVEADDGDKTRYSRSRPQLRMEYDWEADTNVGTTFEMRFKQTAGGIFGEIYDGTYKISFESKDMFGSEVDMIWLYNPGGSSGDVAGELADFTEWQVMRGTQAHNGDGTCDVHMYMNGEEYIYLENETLEGSAQNSFRIGHSGGTGPADGSPADIWMDYVYISTEGAFSPEELSATAVDASTWGSIKVQF